MSPLIIDLGGWSLFSMGHSGTVICISNYQLESTLYLFTFFKVTFGMME